MKKIHSGKQRPLVITFHEGASRLDQIIDRFAKMMIEQSQSDIPLQNAFSGHKLCSEYSLGVNHSPGIEAKG